MIAIMSALTDALAPLLTREFAAAAGTTLFRQGDPIRHYYVVRSGCVHLVRWGSDGSCAVMQRATEDHVLAESSLFGAGYHCDATAVSDSVLTRADIGQVRTMLETDPTLL